MLLYQGFSPNISNLSFPNGDANDGNRLQFEIRVIGDHDSAFVQKMTAQVMIPKLFCRLSVFPLVLHI